MNHIRNLILLCGLICLSVSLSAQSVNCTGGTVSGIETYTGSIFFNYGSVSNAANSKNHTTGSLGESFIGQYFGQTHQGSAGFYSRFLLPPSPPAVTASEGDLQDRIQIEWAVDPLSPSAELGFNIYRDGAFIDHVDKEIRVYIDFNVQAGKFYTYEVKGVNPYGVGYGGSSLGFLNPNGVVTGQCKTPNGNPVIGAGITLAPNLGSALSFGGDDLGFVESHPALASQEWTLSCWVLSGFATQGYIFDFGSGHNKGWWLTLNSNGSNGQNTLSLGVGDGNSTTQIDYTLTSGQNSWHHIAVAFSGVSVLMYVDGTLVQSKPASYAAIDTLPLFIGAKRVAQGDPTNFFFGLIDDIRIYNRQLPQTEINQYKNRTINSDATGLVAYWKLDEGIGTKSYDISPNAMRMFLCGPEWASNHPDIVNGAVTDASGFYKIEGINYGGGTTFTATPSKIVYNNYAIELNAANQQYATLPDSILIGVDSAALEIRVHAFETTPQPRTILSTNSILLQVINGILRLTINGEERNFGLLGAGYQHLIFNQEGQNWSLYKNGTFAGAASFAASNPFASGEAWNIGAHVSSGNYFSGLIDEVAFYGAPLSIDEIQLHYSTGVSIQAADLRSWFPLNESMGNTLEDVGISRTGFGMLHDALWSTVTAISDFTTHTFQPDKRLFTLNGTSTSADQVDFIDLSTVPVSGYVRFEKTKCYQDSVQILVDGVPAVPPIYTDADGKFVGDFEPGVTVRLSPEYKNHVFSPAFWDIKNVNAPVAGLLFSDLTKRSIKGQLAGGDSCHYSVIPSGTEAIITVRTIDECYTSSITLKGEDNADGRFLFTNIPAVPVTIAVSDHYNPIIFDFFDQLGGTRTDLTLKNDTIDFVYIAPPQVEIDTFAKNECGLVQIAQYDKAKTKIRVYEDYYGRRCYLDTFRLTINNNIADRNQYDTLVTKGRLELNVYGGLPNIVTPYTKTLQITADVDGRIATSVLEAVVTGERPRVSTFTSTTPQFPLMILRDPPGDNSYAYIEKGDKWCRNWSFEEVDDLGGGTGSRISLGPDFEIGMGVGIFKAEAIVVVAETTTESIVTKKQTTNTSTEVCFTTTETISTSTNDDIVGEQGGDVFMGAAMNLIFGITDLLLFDTNTCAYVLDTSFLINPDKFSSTYLYSEYHIRNTLLPQLAALHDTVSSKAWNKILEDNEKLKKSAAFDRNLSIDAGVRYEYSVQQDSASTYTHQFGIEFTEEIIGSLGAYYHDLGGHGDNIFQLTQSDLNTTGNSQSFSVKVGYVLEDDDTGDYFSIDIKQDKKFGTPVFKTVSGASSCPWEPNTQPRDEVAITVDKNVAVNVPANEPAVFRLTLGNISQSAEGREYILQTINNSNPNGAIIKVNGQVLTQGIPIFLPFTEGQDFTLTVERGPLLYDYEGLQIGWFVGCEYDRSAVLDIDTDPRFFKAITLDAHFLEPCSPVDINSPGNGDVITQFDHTLLDIRLVEYNEMDADLEEIRVQYRRARANGDWINIAEIPKPLLDPIFEKVPWETSGLSDSDYEIRAITACQSGLNPGISHVITVTMERTPPQLLGTPEPADGVLSLGDEISIAFTEDILCDSIYQADIFNANNIGLYDSETDDLIDATITCIDNRIVIVPNIANKLIEGKILRVEVNTIKDRANNESNAISWEFFVDRGVLELDGGDLYVTMYRGVETNIHRALQNLGGTIASYTLMGAPSWVRVSPSIGSLSPNSEIEVKFTFGADLPEGHYRDTLKFTNSLGDERVIVDLRVLCPAPDWSFDPGAYAQTMTFQVKLDIEGEVSNDEADIVAAYIEGELRGRAQVEFVPEFNDYRAFLTVYGDDDDLGKPVNLAVWDGSACLLFNEVIEDFNFEIDGVVGSSGTPEFLHTNNVVLRKIPLNTGWNWISFNLEFPDASLDPALSSLKHPENDLIKGQTAFAEYFGSSWIGSLAALTHTDMFQFRVDQRDTISMLGGLIDLQTAAIPVNAGWNWIGYIPNQPQTVDQSLSSLNPLNGDLVKSQTGFAQFLAGTGWIGSLKYMEPPKGYKLKISNGGTLSFPANFTSIPEETRGAASEAMYWNVDPLAFEYSMTMVAMFWDMDENATSDDMELGVFDGNEIRGTTQAIYVKALDAHMFFITIYSNTAGNELSFRIYNKTDNEIVDLKERIIFSQDQHLGRIDSPVPFTLGTTGIVDQIDMKNVQVVPNPFVDETWIKFHSEYNQAIQIVISDALGRIVHTENVSCLQGQNLIKWEAHGMAKGIYFIRLESPREATVIKTVHD